MTTHAEEVFDSIPMWTLGDRLRKIRTMHGYTQSDFASAVGATKSAIAQWETDRARPRDLRAVALRIELATGVPAWWTLGLNAESRRPTMSDGGWQYTPRDSNPEPTDLSSAPHHDAADIIALPSACDPATAPERDQPADVVDLATARPGATTTGEVTA